MTFNFWPFCLCYPGFIITGIIFSGLHAHGIFNWVHHLMRSWQINKLSLKKKKQTCFSLFSNLWYSALSSDIMFFSVTPNEDIKDWYLFYPAHWIQEMGNFLLRKKMFILETRVIQICIHEQTNLYLNTHIQTYLKFKLNPILWSIWFIDNI